ncbi:MAG: Arm DNA-binding domain-containing protein [Novosphingobium sp.]
MALKELQVRNICPTDKMTQCTDERGLYLEVHPNGSKLWRYNYRYMGKQRRLALRRYPDVGLAEARERRDDAPGLVQNTLPRSCQSLATGLIQFIMINDCCSVSHGPPNPHRHKQ